MHLTPVNQLTICYHFSFQVLYYQRLFILYRASSGGLQRGQYTVSTPTIKLFIGYFKGLTFLDPANRNNLLCSALSSIHDPLAKATQSVIIWQVDLEVIILPLSVGIFQADLDNCFSVLLKLYIQETLTICRITICGSTYLWDSCPSLGGGQRLSSPTNGIHRKWQRFPVLLGMTHSK